MHSSVPAPRERFEGEHHGRPEGNEGTRPAGLFAKIASRFDADVDVEKDGNVVSGKSIMALMTLEATCGTKLVVTATGPQAKEVLDELEALVQRKFDIPDEQ